MNRNAIYGRNVEILFKNSIVDHKKVINSIRKEFLILGELSNAISLGISNENIQKIK